jgi:hypothetical protein
VAAQPVLVLPMSRQFLLTQRSDAAYGSAPSAPPCGSRQTPRKPLPCARRRLKSIVIDLTLSSTIDLIL